MDAERYANLLTNVCFLITISHERSQFCFYSRGVDMFSCAEFDILLRLTDAVIQLEREIMQQKEKLSSSSSELRIMIR